MCIVFLFFQCSFNVSIIIFVVLILALGGYGVKNAIDKVIGNK